MFFPFSFLLYGKSNLLVGQQNTIVSTGTVLKAEGGDGLDKIDTRGAHAGE
jgi:hypothetical protein